MRVAMHSTRRPASTGLSSCANIWLFLPLSRGTLDSIPDTK